MAAADDFLRLLDHYRATARPLPWRGTRDPYAILVSEVMLQQTRVETVLRYYERFLERFPDLDALAEASEHDLLAAWSGLGYYRRARNLQRAARAVAERGFPESQRQLAELPGIGDYTAAALASIAFGRPAVALDGNALRVFLRYFGLEGDPARASVRRDLEARVLPAIPPEAPGDFTQAVMELGALVCLPATPRCEECPLETGCRARSDGSTGRIPPPRRRRAAEQVLRAAAVLTREGRVLLTRGQRNGLLEGLWECPTADVPPGEAPESALDRFLRDRGLPASLVPLGEVRHGVTFRDIRCQVFRGHPEGEADPAREAWVPREDLGDWPMPSSTRRILVLAGELEGP